MTSTAGTPGGTVTFYSGTTALGTGTLNGSGVATLNTTTLPGGTDNVTASYGAAGNFAASTSSASSITINPATQTITFPAIASRAYGSAPFAVTATSSAGSNYPVTITVQSGPAVINGGTVTLTGAGTVVLQGVASRERGLLRGHGDAELPGDAGCVDRDRQQCEPCLWRGQSGL